MSFGEGPSRTLVTTLYHPNSTNPRQRILTNGPESNRVTTTTNFAPNGTTALDETIISGTGSARVQTRTTFGADGKTPTSRVEVKGEGANRQTTTTAFHDGTSNPREVKVEGPNGTTTTSYAADGKTPTGRVEVDKDKNTTTTSYENGNVTKVEKKGPDGRIVSTANSSYDSEGNRTETTRGPDGKVTSISNYRPDGSRYAHDTYDPKTGNPIQLQRFNEAGQLVGRTTHSGNNRTFETLNPATGQPTEIKRFEGNRLASTSAFTRENGVITEKVTGPDGKPVRTVVTGDVGRDQTRSITYGPDGKTITGVSVTDTSSGRPVVTHFDPKTYDPAKPATHTPVRTETLNSDGSVRTAAVPGRPGSTENVAFGDALRSITAPHVRAQLGGATPAVVERNARYFTGNVGARGDALNDLNQTHLYRAAAAPGYAAMMRTLQTSGANLTREQITAAGGFTAGLSTQQQDALIQAGIRAGLVQPGASVAGQLRTIEQYTARHAGRHMAPGQTVDGFFTAPPPRPAPSAGTPRT